MTTDVFDGRARRHPSRLLLLLALALLCSPAALAAQGAPYRSEPVSYRNASDSTWLTGVLALPAHPGPRPAAVLLSVAGTDPLVERLTREGWAVLVPMRRGFVAVEPLLRATYDDLARDALAALDYLRTRAEVDGARLALIGQADDAPPAMLASVAGAQSVPLVLVAPPAFPGREVFRLEQRGLAEREGARPEELQALDRLVDEIADRVLEDTAPYLRAWRLQAFLENAPTRLPYNAAFPNDQSQAHFFASPLWHDRMAFEPERVLARLRAPVLLLIGSEDPNTPLDAYLAAVDRALGSAPTPDATVCRLTGRTRHAFTAETVDVLALWLLGSRTGAGGSRGEGARTDPLPASGCRSLSAPA